jgi:hypothetical protein
MTADKTITTYVLSHVHHVKSARKTYLTKVLVGEKPEESANEILTGHDFLAFDIL